MPITRFTLQILLSYNDSKLRIGVEKGGSQKVLLAFRYTHLDKQAKGKVKFKIEHCFSSSEIKQIIIRVGQKKMTSLSLPKIVVGILA